MEIIMKVTREDMQLYAVTDTQWLNGRDFYEEIEKVLAAGASSNIGIAASNSS